MSNQYKYSHPPPCELAVLRYLNEEGESPRERVIRLLRKHARGDNIDRLIKRGLVSSRHESSSYKTHLQITQAGRELLSACESSSSGDAHMFAPTIDALYQGGH